MSYIYFLFVDCIHFRLLFIDHPLIHLVIDLFIGFCFVLVNNLFPACFELIDCKLFLVGAHLYCNCL